MRITRKFRTSEKAAPATVANFQRDDTGSLTIFGLFIFLMIVMICGLAVDLMRYENERVAVQNTLDSAVVGASRLNQEVDTDAEVEALVKQYFEKAGYDPGIVEVASNIEVPAGGDEETLRTVSARVAFEMDTAFMPMLGIDSLPGGVGTSAREGQQLIEVALVLDISGSMGSNNRLQNMKDAAKEFVTLVLDNNGTDRVMVSVVPYNMQVQISEDLLGRLDWNNPLTTVSPAPTHPGAIETYYLANDGARCARFLDADFDTRQLAASPLGLERSAKFARGKNKYKQPVGQDFWCGDGYPEMLLYQNDEEKLHAHIDSLIADSMTAIDYGMKWATGVLDPSFRPVLQDMLADSNQAIQDAQDYASANGTTYVAPTDAWMVPDNVAGHPVDYGTENVFKYIVVMTDGSNTEHYDLKDEYKSGPTRVWYSEEKSKEFDPSGYDFDGYYVEMPDNAESSRWFRPRDPNTDTDDTYISVSDFNAITDMEQKSYHDLYNRLTDKDIGRYFFSTDKPARDAHKESAHDVGGYDTADVNLDRICQQAMNGGIEVYAVAFEAPEGGTNALRNCVNDLPGKFFDVDGVELSTAFEAIAAEITKLRLTQ